MPVIIKIAIALTATAIVMNIVFILFQLASIFCLLKPPFFKKIIPQPRKTKRKNYHVALKPLTITTIMSNVWRGRTWDMMGIWENSWLFL